MLIIKSHQTLRLRLRRSQVLSPETGATTKPRTRSSSLRARAVRSAMYKEEQAIKFFCAWLKIDTLRQYVQFFVSLRGRWNKYEKKIIINILIIWGTLDFLQIRSNRGSESPRQGKWLSATRLWSKRCWNHSEFSLYLYSSLYFDSSLSFWLANDSLLSCMTRKVLKLLHASHMSRTSNQLFANKKELNSWDFTCHQ